MIKKIVTPIRAPFWSAGTQYGWEGNPTGIGIRTALFNGMDDSDSLEITVHKLSKTPKTLRIEKAKAKELYAKYNSKFIAKDGTPLVVLPLAEFEEVGEESGI